MEESVLKILNDAEYLEEQNLWFEKLRDIFEGDETRPLVLNGISSWHAEIGPDGAPLYDHVETLVGQDLEALARRMPGARRKDQFRPACVEQGFFGVHFIDRIFGAKVLVLFRR